MQYIGIDYGSKRIGVAVSDETNTLALPYSVVPNNETTTAQIVSIAKEKNADKIVVGKSINLAGEYNKTQRGVEELASELKDKGFEIFFQDERFSSAEAERIQGKGEKIDASAAAIILQSYLDRIKN